MIEMIFNLYEIVISYVWNRFVNHVKNLTIIISQMSFCQGNDHKNVIN